MTLILALKWIMRGIKGVVVASDSRATFGPISYEVKKIHPIILRQDDEEVPIAVAAGAGDATLVKQGYELCDKVLMDMAVKEWSGKTPSFKEFRGAVDRIESSLIDRFRRLRSMGIDIDFNMILTSVDKEGRVSIYLFDERGLAEPVHDNPGFAAIGTGFITGANLLLRLLGYDPEESHMIDLGALTTFIIDVVSEIDPAVGPFRGESCFMRVQGGNVLLGPLKEEVVKEYREKMRFRREIIRRLWRLLDLTSEEEVSAKLKELEEKIGREYSQLPIP